MPLSNLPGPWRWEQRRGYWWRVHQTQGIEDGPHTWAELNLRLGGFAEHGSLWYDRQGEPIPIMVAEDYMADPDYKILKQDVFVIDGEPVKVSTVWLALDHGWMPDRPPMIFETMIFGGKHDLYQQRYSTEEQAYEGHTEMVTLVQLEQQKWSE